MKPATLLGSVLLMLVTSSILARAQVVRLEILSREPAAGDDEILRGRIHGEVDPADRHNAIVQDLALAPRNSRARVEHVATFALASRDLGFPQVAGLTFSDRVVNPVLDYDFGPDFITDDLSGILSRQPPTI